MAKTMIYSPLKIFHHQDKLDKLRNEARFSPVQVSLVPTNKCNQSCKYCIYRMEEYGDKEFNVREEIPFEKLSEILTDCAEMGVKSIQISGGGEPTIYPQFKKLLERIIDLGLEFALITNGTRINDNMIPLLSQAQWIRFSLDAGTEKTYAELRKVPENQFETVLANISKLVDTGPTIGYSFTVTDINYQELLMATKLAYSLGCDNIRFGAVFQNENDEFFDGMYKSVIEQCELLKEYETNDFQVFELFTERFEMLKRRSPDFEFCGIQHFTTFIGADLNVYRCCTQAYNKELGLLGSIKDQKFSQFWEKVDFDFNAKQCPRCSPYLKNKAINYAIQKPQHVNFI